MYSLCCVMCASSTGGQSRCILLLCRTISLCIIFVCDPVIIEGTIAMAWRLTHFVLFNSMHKRRGVVYRKAHSISGTNGFPCLEVLSFYTENGMQLMSIRRNKLASTPRTNLEHPPNIMFSLPSFFPFKMAGFLHSLKRKELLQFIRKFNLKT